MQFRTNTPIFVALAASTLLALPFVVFVLAKSIALLPNCTQESYELATGACAQTIGFQWAAVVSASAAAASLGTLISVLLSSQERRLNIASGDITKLVVLQLVGAVFGLLLLLLFLGGLVQGSLFPNFTPTRNWLTLYMSIQDWARVIIWCFIAGFSERLVPQLLSSLTRDARRDDEKL